VKNSLAYDLQEPFRFLIDLAILNLIETNAMHKRDFLRTENYSLRLRPIFSSTITVAIAGGDEMGARRAVDSNQAGESYADWFGLVCMAG
jgi:hypothetical protein